MPSIIVVGSQWGDEGKGKVIDACSHQADYVVRYQGGANAGHTLKINGQRHVLHLIPSGIFHPHTTCVLGAGLVIDIEVLAQEIKALKQAGAIGNSSQLLISDSATMLLSYHQQLDQAREQHRLKKIGTTGKGIGPAYEDRASRKALLFRDLFEPAHVLKKQLEHVLEEKNILFQKLYHQEPLTAQAILEKILPLRELLHSYRHPDCSQVIHQALALHKKVLFEGAQGALLDLFHGSYPYVTSSNTVASGAMVSCGLGGGSVQKVLAITKGYTTRVGSGPFPTECGSEDPNLQKIGEEWGATTGRMRRCGWLDLVALKYAIRINGITHLAITKMDILSKLPQIPVCTAYQLQGKRIQHFPLSSNELSLCQPTYQKLKGWQKDLSHVKTWSDLPLPAQHYLEFIQKEVGVPINMISFGPAREDSLWLKPLFDIPEDS